MERSDAIGLFEQSESLIKMFLKEIKQPKENPHVFRGKVSIKVFKIAENIVIVRNYIRDGKKDSERLKSEYSKFA